MLLGTLEGTLVGWSFKTTFFSEPVYHFDWNKKTTSLFLLLFGASGTFECETWENHTRHTAHWLWSFHLQYSSHHAASSSSSSSLPVSFTSLHLKFSTLVRLLFDRYDFLPCMVYIYLSQSPAKPSKYHERHTRNASSLRSAKLCANRRPLLK